MQALYRCKALKKIVLTVKDSDEKNTVWKWDAGGDAGDRIWTAFEFISFSVNIDEFLHLTTAE